MSPSSSRARQAFCTVLGFTPSTAERMRPRGQLVAVRYGAGDDAPLDVQHYLLVYGLALLQPEALKEIMEQHAI